MQLTIGLLTAALWFALPMAAEAKTLRWANDGDVASMDPYFINESFLVSFMLNVYEPLVQRDKNLNLEPALATTWEQTSPTVWRFTLRQGVKFHDGSSFTADDVLFSYQRAIHEGSDIKSKFASIAEVKKIDDHTVDFITSVPNPLLPRELSEWAIVSKVWAEKNGAVEPSDTRKKTENFATRNANGTGPFMLKAREPDVRTVLAANPAWWGKVEHNLSEVVFTPIKSAATRVAALISGEVDMVYTVPLQDVERIDKTPGRKMLQGPELRTVFLGMDQTRDRLEDSNIADRNPFKDVRVRQAVYQAIDIEAIKSRVMRGAARPTGLMIGAGVNGFDVGLNQRFPFDPQAAQKLLAEAGYPDGFEISMNCPNDRYVNDEQICLAIVPMLKRIGIAVKLTAETKATYFQKILSRNTSFYMLGWTPGTYDAHNALFNLMASPKPDGQGKFNLGGYSNARVDELTAAIRTEGDPARRLAMMHEAFKIHKDEFGHVPLHQQALAWGVKSNIDLVQLADNFFMWRWVRID